MYQPKTGARCGCRPGVQRDNCQNCEGTGMVIDFHQIRVAVHRKLIAQTDPKCPNCGHPNPSGRACSYCGHTYYR